MNNITIERLTYENIKAVADIDKECFDNNAWSESLYRDELQDKNKYYFVAKDKDKVIGYGGFSHIIDEAHIMNIAVTGSYRAIGVGSKIIEKLIEQARNLMIKSITLEVNENNKVAIEFYLKYKFVIKGKRPGYYSNKDSALILWYMLED